MNMGHGHDSEPRADLIDLTRRDNPTQVPETITCSAGSGAAEATIGSGRCVSSGSSRRDLRERSMPRQVRMTNPAVLIPEAMQGLRGEARCAGTTTTGLTALLIAVSAVNVWNRVTVATRQVAGEWKP
jgi:hypothetical protein